MLYRILRAMLIATVFFSCQTAMADDADVEVLSGCTERIGDDPTLMRRSTIPPNTSCADATAYDITVSIRDGWLGFVQHVRFAPGLAHTRERDSIDPKEVLNGLWVCQKVSPDGKIVNEWFARTEAGCRGREITATLYRRYIRETNPDTGAREVKACLVLSKTRAECRLISWFSPDAQARIQASLARADARIAQQAAHHQELAHLRK